MGEWVKYFLTAFLLVGSYTASPINPLCYPADRPVVCHEGDLGTGMYCWFPNGSVVRQVCYGKNNFHCSHYCAWDQQGTH